MEECHLQETIRGCINQLLENIETKHGHMFVSRALGYVTAGYAEVYVDIWIPFIENNILVMHTLSHYF